MKPQSTAARIAALEQRVEWLEAELRALKQKPGICLSQPQADAISQTWVKIPDKKTTG